MRRSVGLAVVGFGAVASSGCVIQDGGDSLFGMDMEFESQPYVAGQDWSGWTPIRYKVTHTTCPEQNRGEWLDGDMGWVEVQGDTVMLGFTGFPQLEGQLDGSRAPMQGQMWFMASDEKTLCDVTGDITLGPHEMKGDVTEELSGGIECSTTGTFSLRLPRAQ